MAKFLLSAFADEAGEELSLSFTPDDGKLYFYKNTDYIFTLDMEAFEKASDGQATKIIIPSDIQGAAGLVASLTALGKK